MNYYNIMIWGYVFPHIAARNPFNAAKKAITLWNQKSPDESTVSIDYDADHILYQIDDGEWHEWDNPIPADYFHNRYYGFSAQGTISYRHNGRGSTYLKNYGWTGRKAWKDFYHELRLHGEVKQIDLDPLPY